MVWQDVFAGVGSRLDADHEREVRLAEQARLGADWAFAALVARYQPPVTRYLTRLTGSTVRSRDLAEELFVRMEQRLHGPHGGQHLRLWLLRAATETGLDALRQPTKQHTPRLPQARQPAALLDGPGDPGSAVSRLRTTFGKLAAVTGSTNRQVRRLIWSPRSEESANGALRDGAQDTWDSASAFDAAEAAPNDAEEQLDPRDALRYRMVRAVLAELPYGDAQCLALHLVAGLNQAEVAMALGITPSATRRRVVQGLNLFARRYDAAVASLGLPADFFAEPEAASADQRDGQADEALDAPYGVRITGRVTESDSHLPIPVAANAPQETSTWSFYDEPTLHWEQTDQPQTSDAHADSAAATVAPHDTTPAADAEPVIVEATLARPSELVHELVDSEPPAADAAQSSAAEAVAPAADVAGVLPDAEVTMRRAPHPTVKLRKALQEASPLAAVALDASASSATDSADTAPPVAPDDVPAWAVDTAQRRAVRAVPVLTPVTPVAPVAPATQWTPREVPVLSATNNQPDNQPVVQPDNQPVAQTASTPVSVPVNLSAGTTPTNAAPSSVASGFAAQVAPRMLLATTSHGLTATSATSRVVPVLTVAEQHELVYSTHTRR